MDPDLKKKKNRKNRWLWAMSERKAEQNKSNLVDLDVFSRQIDWIKGDWWAEVCTLLYNSAI